MRHRDMSQSDYVKDRAAMERALADGDWQALERLAQAALQVNSADAFAWQSLAQAAAAVGHTDIAQSAFREAQRHAPPDAQFLLTLGGALAQSDWATDALRTFDRVIALAPGDYSGYAAKANLLLSLGRIDEGMQAGKRAMALDPDAQVLALLASLHRAKGQAADALHYIERAIQDNAQVAAYWLLLAQVRQDLGEHQAALRALLNAMELDPQDERAWVEASRVCRALGLWDDAYMFAQQAEALAPGAVTPAVALAQVHLRRGAAAEALAVLELAHVEGDRDPVWQLHLAMAHEALKANRLALSAYEAAIRLAPEFAPAHNNMGLLLVRMGRYMDGLQATRRAVELAPDHVEMWSNLGHVLQDLGELDESLACYRRALALNPDQHAIRSNLLFGLNYQPEFSVDAAFAEAKEYGRRVMSAAAKSPIDEQKRDAQRQTKRLGFVSGDFRQHPVGYFFAPVLDALMAEGVEVYLYANQSAADTMTARLKGAATCFRRIDQLDDRAAAQLIADDELDVLIDLSGHTAHNRLPVFAYRPAPLQLTWLGYFATTGLDAIDAILADEKVLPRENEAWFTEQVLRVSPSYLCYEPPDFAVPIESSRRQEKNFVFGCFNNPSKLNESVIRLWAQILNRAPGAELMLMAKPYADPQVRARFRGRFIEAGAPPKALRFSLAVDRKAYFAAHNQVDMVLDPFPYPGGTTSADAWWMGVPVLSLAGASFVSRNALSISNGMGERGYWAKDEDAYLAQAVRAAHQGHRTVAERERLRRRAEAANMLNGPNVVNALLRVLAQ
jgi:predicted O-linked N-acetylglucosamine transferase (SPINDLY family)